MLTMKILKLKSLIKQEFFRTQTNQLLSFMNFMLQYSSKRAAKSKNKIKIKTLKLKQT